MDLRERAASVAARHPWEFVRARFFERVLADHGLLAGPTWLDVGAGDAWFATELRGVLAADARVTAWDINYSPEDLADPTLSNAGIELAAERPTDRFSRVLLLDVIEHVEDADGFLAGIVDDLLAADGRVLISVPAYQALFSRHDTALGHHRRYSPSELRATAARAGLNIEASGGLFTSLLGARALIKLRENASSRAPAEWAGIGAWSGGDLVTRATIAVLSVDAAVGRIAARAHVPLPGLSCWVLCTRAG